jgi:hypothetical protein
MVEKQFEIIEDSGHQILYEKESKKFICDVSYTNTCFTVKMAIDESITDIEINLNDYLSKSKRKK